MNKPMYAAITLIETVFDRVEVIDVIGIVPTKDGIGNMVCELNNSRWTGVYEEGDFGNLAELIAPAVACFANIECKGLQAAFV